MYQEATESTSMGTSNESLMPSGVQSPVSLLHKCILVLLLICVLWRGWQLYSMVNILIEYLDLSLLTSLPTSLKSEKPGAVFSGKQLGLDVS